MATGFGNDWHLRRIAGLSRSVVKVRLWASSPLLAPSLSVFQPDSYPGVVVCRRNLTIRIIPHFNSIVNTPKRVLRFVMLLTPGQKVWYNEAMAEPLDGHKRKTSKKFERKGMSQVLGRTLTRGDHAALGVLREMVRGYWLIFADELDPDNDWREIIRARIELAKTTTAAGNKAAELIFRYALGDKAPTGHEQKTRLEILIKQVLESPLILNASEIEAIEIVENRHGLLAPSGPDADSSAPDAVEAGGGRGAGRQE